ANEPTASSQVASLGPTLRTNFEQFELISTPTDPPHAGSRGSAIAAIVVPVDGGHPRNKRALGASFSAARNQAVAGLPRGQSTTVGPTTAVVSGSIGDENAAPQQHAQYVCECTLLPTTKKGRSGEWKLAFGCTHPNCNKVIIRKSNAKVHRHTHDIARPVFRCDGDCGCSCGKSFAHKRDLNRHKLEAHVDAKKYPCTCGRSYTRLHDLKRHNTVVAARSRGCPAPGVPADRNLTPG
ncbi:hypothetical protein HK405_012301, partial [Cladochytrium tenue]